MKRKKRFLLCFAALWIAQMAAAFWFCTQKQGFHEDEYYTYYSTARTNGFYVEDGAWMERDVYRNEFVVLPDERFQYGLVKQVQSWDVHPPMYYWVFHTAASLVPGVFSKWTGLSVNLFFHGINLILLTLLSYLLAGGDGKLALLVTFVYGCSPAAMSGVVFIRMYEMLTTFVLLSAILHARAVYRNDKKLSAVRSLLPMAVVTYVGFLTHYYFFLFLFFQAAAFCVWLLWRDKKVWNCLRYGLFQAAAFGLAYLTYPVFPAQMFKGQRGAQATENFFDLSNTFARFRFFGDLLNRYVFGGLLGLAVLVLLAAFVVCLRDVRRKGKGDMPGGEREVWTGHGRQGQDMELSASFFILLISVAGYFVAVSKTALILGDTSVRYQLPVYGIVVLLVFLAGRELWKRGMESAVARGFREKNLFAVKWWRGAACLAVLLCVAAVVSGYRQADVAFLYPEDAAQTAFAKEQAEDGVFAVYLYHPGEEWCIWDVTDELLAYPAVYFAKADGTGRIADEKIERAEKLVVYLAKGADAGKQLTRLAGEDGAPVQNGLQLIFEEKYCDVYCLQCLSFPIF